MAWLKSRPASQSAAPSQRLPSFDLAPSSSEGLDVDLEDEKSDTVAPLKLAAGSIPPPRIGELPPPPLASTIPPRGATYQATSTPAAERKSELHPGSGTLAWVTRIENAALGRLSPAMRDRVGQHRTAALVATGGVTLALLFAFGFGASALLRSPTTEQAALPGTVDAPATGAPDATAAGTALPAAPRPDTAPSPQDEASVLFALADSLLKQHRDAEVPALIARLIARRPELKDDERLKRTLLASASSSDARAVGESFALLTGPMGEPGASLVYELSLKPDARATTRARAQNWLTSKDFERTSALPVYAAVRLRNAKTCEDKRGLLDFAAQAGGPYVLSYLKELEAKTACGPDDLEHCYPCLRNDTHLTETITKLEKR